MYNGSTTGKGPPENTHYTKLLHMREYLVLRGTKFCIRRRLPLDLVELFNRDEIIASLGTSDKRKAAEICRARAAHMDRVFAEGRASLKGKADNPAAAQAVAAMDKDHPHKAADRANLSKGHLHAPAKDWNEALLAAAQGRESKPLVQVQDAPAPRNTPAARDLDSLIKRWAKERSPTPATQATMVRAVDRFRSLVGDMPVTAIKKTHVVTFKDRLLETYTEKNTNYYLTQITVLCGFAISQGWMETNPAVGVKLRIADDGPVRLAFTEQHLNAIFKSSIYSAGYRHPNSGESDYWLPLLALFTGARIEELCQLSPNDVKQDTYRDENGQERDAWVFILTNEGEGQRLKNSGSKRRLPIHAELLARGFIKYVDSRRGKDRILTVTVSPRGSHSANWSTWWHKYQRAQIKITDKRFVFHSFRHTFKDLCRELGIDKGIRDAIQGHSEGGAAGGYGGEYYPLRPLVEAMAKYRVAGVVLPN